MRCTKATVLFSFLAVLFLLSMAMAGQPGQERQPSDQWTEKGAMQFAEDLFSLIEIVKQETGSDAEVSLTSYKIGDGSMKILELRFKDRVVSIKIHRNVAAENRASLEAISPLNSFFQKGL